MPLSTLFVISVSSCLLHRNAYNKMWDIVIIVPCARKKNCSEVFMSAIGGV